MKTLSPGKNNFTPPGAGQVEAYLGRCQPTGPARWTTIWPMIALIAAACLIFLANEAMALLTAILLMAALPALLTWRIRGVRDLERRAAYAGELAMMRYYPQGLRLAWRLLPRLRAMPELHGRTVSVIAYCLDQVKAHESAIVAYDYLVTHLPPGHPGSVQFTIERAINELLTERLTDADDALRRLRGQVGNFPNSPISASYRLADLLQQVQTNHFAEAVEKEPDLIEQLRPLGVEAAYGYALMALSYSKLSGRPSTGSGQGKEAIEQMDEQAPSTSSGQAPSTDSGQAASTSSGQAASTSSGQAAKATQWWERATLLLPASALVGRFSVLAPLAQGVQRA